MCLPGLKSISAQKRKAQEVSLGLSFTRISKSTISTVSTGIRFTTIPDATPPSFQVPPLSSSPLSMASKAPPLQPPTTISTVFNPMMGHISSAYSAQVSRDLSLASRFDFNVYSYESEWAMGAEWWLRRSSGKTIPSVQGDNIDVPISENSPQHLDDVHGVIKARASTNKVSSSLGCDKLSANIILGCIHNVGGSIAQYAS